MKFSRVFFRTLIIVFVLGFSYIAQVKAVGITYTICDSGNGCNFETLTEAIAFGVTGDTVVISNPFTFNDALEDNDLFLPTDLTLQCEAGVTYGDAGQNSKLIWPASGNLIQDCTFENINFDTTFGNDVSFYNNDFSSAAVMAITLTGTDGFEIIGNTGLQKIQAQAPKNGLIDNNTFECRFGNNCITLTNDTPENITISNNIITNYNPSTGGDYVHIQKGINITYTGNTLRSEATDDIFIPMMTIQSGDIEISDNYFLLPEKPNASNNGTWAINIRVVNEALDALIENNTIVDFFGNTVGGSDSAIGLFDDGTSTNVPINIIANYNLFTRTASLPGGNGINLNYVLGSADVSLTESFNGFFGVTSLIQDSNAIYTSMNANTLTSDPLLRTEDLDSSNDLYPSPISRYLDIDGTNDIGAYGNAGGLDRISTYLIDDNCIVDYINCFSNTSYVLQHAVSSNDDVNVAAGTYDPFTLDYPANNVQMTGAGGVSTVFDAAGVEAATINLSEITNSHFSNFMATGASVIVPPITYEISLLLFEFGGNDYNQSTPVVGSSDVALLFSDSICSVIPVSADNTDITTAVNNSNSDFNLALVDFFGNKLTIIIPDAFASNQVELIDYVLNNCGSPVTVDLFINSAFTFSSNEYTYNNSAVTLAGATLLSGLTDPPSITDIQLINDSGAIMLQNSDDNIFEDIFLDGNVTGLFIDSDSEGNNFVNSAFQNNTQYDIYSEAIDLNILEDSSFDLDEVEIVGAGDLEVYNSVIATILRSDNNDPINNAQVEIENASNISIETSSTDINGETSFSAPILSYILSGTGPYSIFDGGLNPFTFNVSASGYSAKSVNQQIDNAFESFIITLNPINSGGGGGGGGGGGPLIPKPIKDQDQSTNTSCSRNSSTIVPFIDISSHWGESYINTLYRRCIIDGKSTMFFEPDSYTSRAELVKIMVNLFDIDKVAFKDVFLDVGEKDWFSIYVISAFNQEIISGYSNSAGIMVFKPNQLITRAEALKVILKAKGINNFDGYTANFDDVSNEDWFYGYVAYAEEKGIIVGYDENSNFRPNNPITRSEIAKLSLLIEQL